MNLLKAIFGGTSQINVETYRDDYFKNENTPHILLDIRNPQEYSDEHIEGAVNIPLNKLPKKIDKLPQDKTIICIGRSGTRSREAAQILQKAGYKDVINLMGGTLAWRQIGEDFIRKN